MGKELFENIKTGETEYIFHWHDERDAEDLKKFLESSYLSEELLSLKKNTYLVKVDDYWEHLRPKDMIYKYAYVGDVVAEEKSKNSFEKIEFESEEDKKKVTAIWEKLNKLIETYSKKGINFLPGIVNENDLYEAYKFWKEANDIVMNLEDNYNLNVTRPFWDLIEANNPFKKEKDVGEVLIDFDWESAFNNNENKIIKCLSEAYQDFQNFEEWWAESENEGSNFTCEIYDDDLDGHIQVRAEYYDDGKILYIEQILREAEYNPY